MFYVQPTGLNGFTPSEVTLPNCINRSGATMAVGDVVMLDLAASATELTTSAAASYLPGGENTVWNTVIAPTAVGIATGILGVVTDPDGIADNATGKVTFYGVVDAYVIQASGTVIPGSPMVATTAKNLDATVATNERVIALWNAPSDTAGSRKLKQVMFNGVGGFGFSGNVA